MYSYRYERLVQWGDCDPAGIIFFPNYLRWVADGLSQMFLELGFDPAKRPEPDIIIGMPSVGCALQFHIPAKVHDRIIHEIRVARIGRKSATFAHRFLRGADCLAAAEETRIWALMKVSTQELDSIQISNEMRGLLESGAL